LTLRDNQICNDEKTACVIVSLRQLSSGRDRFKAILFVAAFRIASPEMLLNINLLPHLICSFWASGSIGGYEAGEHDDTG
jgi:hypothetical protein